MNEYNENGERHGPWEKYNSNGKSYCRANYVNGKMHGLYEDYYYTNGKLSDKVNFVNGKQHGLSERYWFDGKLNIKQYYL